MYNPIYIKLKTVNLSRDALFVDFLYDYCFVLYSVSVISDAMCEQRFWDMKHMGTQNFYLCEVQKDLTIDATFKGNCSRFLNHSCDPNCNLEKWSVC